jgi:hypothetical protein
LMERVLVLECICFGVTAPLSMIIIQTVNIFVWSTIYKPIKET